jgi:hypothetical protein
VSFEYGLTDSYGFNAKGNPPSLTNPGMFSASVSGLTTGKTYHYRAKADAGTAGIVYGEDRTFIAGNTGIEGKIVFSSQRNENYPEIYSMNADGTNQTRLTNSAGYDYQPAYSPDGIKIAFVSTRDGPYNIYVMNADGSNQVRLTTSSGDWCPTWSPDGTKIAFFSGRTNTSQIYIMDSDGSDQRQMTNSGANFTPDWSNGNKILYVADIDDLSGTYTMDPNGTHKTRIKSGIFQENDPKWSPDVTKIVYVNSNYEIYSMNADGTGKIKLKRSLSNSPRWSPNGDWTSPNITTLDASTITRTSATLNGQITCLGGATSINVCFEYGTTTEYGKSTVFQEITSIGSFAANLTDLIPGSYHCRVKAIGDGIVYGNDFIFTNLAEPTIKSFTPKIGGTGTSVIISGTNFDGATAVNIGGTPAYNFTVDSNTQITAVLGNGSTGKISVTTPNGVAVSADNFTYYVAPVITTLDSLPSGEVKGNYGPVTLEVSGGMPPYKWAKSGTWPSGLKISKDGVISGKPSVKITEPTDYVITVAVTDSASTAGTRSSSTSEMTISQVQENIQNGQDRQIISSTDQSTTEDEDSLYIEETDNQNVNASSNNVVTKSSI